MNITELTSDLNSRHARNHLRHTNSNKQMVGPSMAFVINIRAADVSVHRQAGDQKKKRNDCEKPYSHKAPGSKLKSIGKIEVRNLRYSATWSQHPVCVINVCHLIHRRMRRIQSPQAKPMREVTIEIRSALAITSQNLARVFSVGENL